MNFRKSLAISSFATWYAMCDHTPCNGTMTLQETPDIFQRRNNSTVIKACWSLSAKNCHCIKERANSDPFAIAVTVRRVDRRSQKISAVCWMRLRQNMSILCQVIGSAA